MDDIKTVVRETIRELQKMGFLIRSEDFAYKDASATLYQYYETEFLDSPESSPVKTALDSIRSDPYFRVIPLYYMKHMTIEEIAEFMDVDTSTIVRNKKRLCLEIYRHL